MYGQRGCKEVDLLIVFCTTALLDFLYAISAAGYNLQRRSVFCDGGEISPWSEYKSSAGKIPHPHRMCRWGIKLALWLNEKN